MVLRVRYVAFRFPLHPSLNSSPLPYLTPMELFRNIWARIRIFSDLLQPLHDPCPFPFAFPLDLLVLPLYEHESFFSPLLLQLLKLVEDLLLVLFGCCLLHVLFAHHQICQNFLSFAQNAPLTVSQRLSSSIRPSNCSSHLT